MILDRGAEAVLEQTQGVVKKIRERKQYRHPVLDHQLRQFRTRREAKVLEKIPVRAPKLIRVDDEDMVVEMEYVDAPQLRDVLTAANAEALLTKLGVMMKRVHDADIIHGDLTTSNVLVEDGELCLIDFGLSFFSDKVEDKAVDLHLLKEALHAKHPGIAGWEYVSKAYGDSEVLERLLVVEQRGRYKQKSH